MLIKLNRDGSPPIMLEMRKRRSQWCAQHFINGWGGDGLICVYNSHTKLFTGKYTFIALSYILYDKKSYRRRGEVVGGYHNNNI